MKKFDFDVDIDMADRDKFLEHVTCTPAMVNNDVPTKHNTGVYFQNIPRYPLEGFATLDYKEADEEGYLKIDFLNNSVYEEVRSEDHLQSLIDKEPMWELLEHEEVVKGLYHVSKYAKLLKQYKPKSVYELAMFLALIRPGKKHLIGKSWLAIEKEIWGRPEDGYFFKKAHAISYAMVIVVQLNLLSEKA